jgi:hypothetical protein
MLVLAFTGLIVIEMALFESFLPFEWQHAISQWSEQIFHTQKYEPHPDMGWEFELDYRQHPSHRVAMYGFLGALVLGGAYLISRVWSALRQIKRPVPD